MRRQLALAVALATMTLAVATGQQAWAQAQQETRREPGQTSENQRFDRDRNQAGAETIRGIVAGITAEGEATYDYRANRGAMASAAFLTVVGSPANWDASRSENRAAVTGGERKATANGGQNGSAMGKKRHNVYMVWMTPRTKVCESSGNAFGAANTAERRENRAGKQDQGEKKECALDQVEIGDHVEIKFNVREESGANSNNLAHQTEQMRQKHGRNRTYVGYATEITILPSQDDSRHDSSAERKPGESNR